MSLITALYSHLTGAYNIAFTAVAATNLITAAGHARINGDKVRVSSTTTLPGGLSANTDYFVISMSGNTFKLSLTSGGTEIDITSTGTGTHTLGTAVSDLVTNKIYPGQAPQTASVPYIVYKRISSQRFPHMTAPSGLARDRMQFDIYGTTQISAEAIRNALRLWLDGYDKSMGTELLDVRLASLENETDQLVVPEDASDTGTFTTTADYFITFAETIPAH